MIYGLIYRLEFKNVEGNTVRVDITPTDVLIPDGDTPEVIALKPGAAPLVISTSNDAEDKFEVIRSKSAEIQFVTDTSAGLDSATFSQGGDDLWFVTATLIDTGDNIFTGFLIMADNQQPFQPDPQYVTLTATDHLAALKEVPLTNLIGETPTGKYRVADLVTFCLRKTGLILDLFVVNNLRIGSGRLVNQILFSSAGDYIVTAGLITTWFYVGQQFAVTGSVSNNTTFTVVSIDNTGLATQVFVAEDITVGENTAGVTLTDILSDSHWMDIVYVDAKTFESSINECEDCYTVLQKILGEDNFITQYKGAWWIFRVDEMEDNPVYVAEFSPGGTYIDTAAGTQYDKDIGFTEDSKFANADTLLRFIRPHGFIKETFRYQTPLEVPCNSNFERGDYVSGANPKLYELECWALRRGLPGAYNTPITITANIVREFNQNDYEIERYIQITPQTGHTGFSSTDDEYIESEAIPVLAGDKFTSSIQWRIDTDIASSSAQLRLFRFVLLGADGANYILGEDSVGDGIHKWFPVTFAGTPVNTGKGATGIVFGDQDEREWQTISWNAPPVPVSGDLYIWVAQFYNNAAVPPATIVNWSNFQFEYIPLINGTYARLTGQYSRIDRTATGYMANRDKEVYLSDSPLPLFKGSMFFIIGGVSRLITNWFAAAAYGLSYPPDMTYVHPYGFIQAYAVWNQYKGYNHPTNGRGIGINIFTGSIKGLTQDWPDLIHRYNLTDANVQTNNRYFILISVSWDWKSCLWTGTWIEVYNRVLYKSYNDPFTFSYLLDNE